MGKDLEYSTIVPFFNEEEVLLETYRRLKKVMEDLKESYEIIFVDDASTDTSNKIIKDLFSQDKNIRLLTFTRNFGQDAAISAGIDFASGKATVIIDADLQDPPELIPELIAKWKQGYDIVYAKRTERKGETFLQKMAPAIFCRILRCLVDFEMPVDVGNFCLIDHKVCTALKKLRQKKRYIRGLISSTRYKHTEVKYVREKRWAGVSKTSFAKKIKLSIDALISLCSKPLKIAISIGLVLVICSFIYSITIISQILSKQTIVANWALLMILNLCFIGIISIIFAILGVYICRRYEEARQEPLYIIAEKVGFLQKDD